MTHSEGRHELHVNSDIRSCYRNGVNFQSKLMVTTIARGGPKYFTA